MKIESELFKNMSSAKFESIKLKIAKHESVFEDYAKDENYAESIRRQVERDIDFQDIVSITKCLYLDELRARKNKFECDRCSVQAVTQNSDMPDGWGWREDTGYLCPDCYKEYKKVIFEFNSEKHNTIH